MKGRTKLPSLCPCVVGKFTSPFVSSFCFHLSVAASRFCMLAQSLPPALSGRLRGGLHLHLCILHRTCVLCLHCLQKKKKNVYKDFSFSSLCAHCMLRWVFIVFGYYIWTQTGTCGCVCTRVCIRHTGGSKTPADLLIKALWTHVRSGCIVCLDGLLWLYPCEDTSPVFSLFDRENPPVDRQKKRKEKRKKWQLSRQKRSSYF